MCSNQIKMIDRSLHFCYSKYYRNIATEGDRHGGQRDNLNSTAQYSTAQHSDCAFFSTVRIHKRKRIKASINMYMDKMYVLIGAFFCLIGGNNLI